MAMSGTLHTQTGLLIEIFNEMGGVWIKLNELDSAKDCLERCLNLINSLPEAKAETLKLVIVKVYRRKAELAVALKRYTEAIEWVDQAMSVLPKVNAYHELVRLQK
ncbi:Tetratricopeptide repeat [Weissella viridescens]|nr:Tetratricopeptide repeat [Weissella viridescens]